MAPYAADRWDTHSGRPGELSLDDYSKVSGYYGPGVVGSWILIGWSIVVSWTLNPRHELFSKDTISNEFIALLAYPLVAVGHFFIQYANFPGSAWHAALPKDKSEVPFATSMHTSVRICHVFMGMSCLFFTIWLMCAMHPEGTLKLITRRSGAFAVLSLLCSVATILGQRHGDLDLPFINLLKFFADVTENAFALFFPIMLLGILVPVILVILLPVGVALEGLGRNGLVFYLASSVDAIRESPMLLFWTPFKAIKVVGLLFPFLFMAAIMIWILPVVITINIPTSNSSLWDLDQATALTGGLITFVFSVHNALRERSWDKTLRRRVGEMFGRPRQTAVSELPLTEPRND